MADPYDLSTACDISPDVCLGVPYFNWGPAYKGLIEAIKAGTWKQSWDYNAPDWTNINDPDTSAVGFTEGPALSAESKKSLDEFISKMAAYATDPANKDTFWLWQGPLSYADGTVLAKDGEKLPMIAKPEDGPSVLVP